ncbi:hypothetical protein B0H14DRAFT_2595414 [Mycena olivaceomarginata]|nr:hypothetical protein B0H14DRAFT_2595414 [Mycena olivaceomarginata]
MSDCFLVLLGIYPQIVGGGNFFLVSSYKIQGLMCRVKYAYTGDRHNTSARYHPPPALQKYQLNPELYPVPQEVLFKISGVIRPDTQVVEDWVEKEDVEMED